MSYRIEIEAGPTDKDGFEHVIVRGHSLDGDTNLATAMQSIKDSLYSGHSVYARVPLEIESKAGFATKRTRIGGYLRIYRKPGDEWVKLIDRALGKDVDFPQMVSTFLSEGKR